MANSGASWKDDEKLKGTMTKLVQQGLQRTKALDFLERDFPEYPWSIRTLDRRFRHFEIFYNDESVDVEELRTAVANELKGPGKLLGYRAILFFLPFALLHIFSNLPCWQGRQRSIMCFYSLSSYREHQIKFWHVCFLTNQMRDETATDNQQTTTD